MTLAQPDTDSVPRRTLRGAVALLARQALVQGLNVLGGIALARMLSPSEFGVYAVVTFALVFCAALSDVGLGAGLIRQREDPAETDYRTVLAAQHTLTVTLGLALWLAAPWLARVYEIPPGGVVMFRLLALALPVTSLQAVSSIRLERGLRFDRLALVETGQALVYNVTLVLLVWKGFGVASFGVGLLARAATGAALAWLAAPWRVGWRRDGPRLRGLLAFGIPYQGASIVSLVKDSITPVLVGLLIGTAAVGHINWAQMVAAYPVIGLMALQRLYLPSFALMQSDRDGLRSLLEHVIRMTNAIVAPLAVLTLVLIRPITEIVFGDKWLPALPLFYLLWVANLAVPTVTPLLGLLNALGRSRTTLGFALLWMSMTWLLGWPGVVLFGALGFALANLVVQTTAWLVYRVALGEVRFRLTSAVLPSWLVALAMGLAVHLVARAHPPAGLAELAGFVLGGLLLAAAGLAALWRRDLVRVARLFGGSRGAADIGRP